MDFFTTKTGAKVLGYTQETLKWYAYKYKIGAQPGGPGTPYIFTLDDLLAIRKRNIGELGPVLKGVGKRGRSIKTQMMEDRVALGLGKFFDPDGRPR